jgi:chemotaxis-related protein WspB
MLFLHFRIGEDAFALAVDGIVEILPLMDLSRVRDAAEGLAGSFDYRSRFVPVVDLCQLELGRPARRRMSTRIVVVRLPEDEQALVGLIAEDATDTLRCDPTDFAPFVAGPRGLVQRIALPDLLPVGLRLALRSELAEG